MNTDYLKEKKILLVDDEPELLTLVASILNENGYNNLRTAKSVKAALQASNEFHPDITVLDVMLPDGNGFQLLEQLKQSGEYPVLFLTARGEDEDRFHAYGLGADDYMVKPFIPKELVYKITAILRRCYKSDDRYADLADCRIDFSRAEVVREKECIPLTAKEVELLNTLYRNAGKIVTIDALCESLWGDNPYGYEESLMSHVRRVRKKIEQDPSHPVSLITVKGLGYKLMVREDNQCQTL